MSKNVSRNEHASDPDKRNATVVGSTTVPVETIQKRLKARGYDIGRYGADGDFGSATEKAVIRFQTHNGLTPDGVVGPLTWSRLEKPVATKPRPMTSAEKFAQQVADRVTGGDGHPHPRYVFGYEIANLADDYPTKFDCSEAMQWGVYQQTGNSWVDGSVNQYPACHKISVAEARKTVGALVFLTDNGHPSGIHHVGVVYKAHSTGKMYVAQARSAHTDPECGLWPFDSQSWDYAGKIPLLKYA